MKKIVNPFVTIPTYNCFGCSPNNEHGLQMKFEEDGDEIVCKWHPTGHFQGYGNVLHGGIQGAMMDEIAGWLVLVKLKTAGVTSKMEIRYKKPVLIDGGEITLRARLGEMKRNIAVIKAELCDSSGTVCSTGDVWYFTLSEKDAREKLRYPGLESFYA